MWCACLYGVCVCGVCVLDFVVLSRSSTNNIFYNYELI